MLIVSEDTIDDNIIDLAARTASAAIDALSARDSLAARLTPEFTDANDGLESSIAHLVFTARYAAHTFHRGAAQRVGRSSIA